MKYCTLIIHRVRAMKVINLINRPHGLFPQFSASLIDGWLISFLFRSPSPYLLVYAITSFSHTCVIAIPDYFSDHHHGSGDPGSNPKRRHYCRLEGHQSTFATFDPRVVLGNYVNHKRFKRRPP